MIGFKGLILNPDLVIPRGSLNVKPMSHGALLQHEAVASTGIEFTLYPDPAIRPSIRTRDSCPSWTLAIFKHFWADRPYHTG
jgi:hypothetical protein